MVEAAAEGREAYTQGRWADAHRLLGRVPASDLDADDLHRYGMAAYLIGRDDEADTILALAHQAWVVADDRRRAAREAFFVGLMHVDRHEMAQAGGWFGRGIRMIAGFDECAETGLLMIPDALGAMFGGDPEAALVAFRAAGAVGERVADADLVSLARLGEGQCLVSMQRTEEGLRLLDETMIAVVANDTMPIVSGLIFCAVIETCQKVLDIGRSAEWTAALSGWCDSRPDMQSHRGRCLVHRAEVMRLAGDWDGALVALEAARRALGEVRRPALAAAFYELGEVHRLRGDYDEADAAYREASRLGHDPRPGFPRLRLQQGRTEDAWRALEGDHADDNPGLSATMEMATVEIGLACGRDDEAVAAWRRLSDQAEALGTRFVVALAQMCEGLILLQGSTADAAAACGPLRRAVQMLQLVDAPVEAARARVAFGRARSQLGDRDTAALEFDAARRTFVAVGARPDLDALDALDEPQVGSRRGGLTDREIEVLACAARGLTNRQIADELHLSQHTVRRHLQNIYVKVGVSTRAAATSWAHRHGLLR